MAITRFFIICSILMRHEFIELITQSLVALSEAQY